MNFPNKTSSPVTHNLNKKIVLNKAHFPVTVLGPGKRIGIWVQGCKIQCKGCISQDTWQNDPSRQMTVGQLLAWCRKMAENGLDGVTISGGEPFDQAPALKVLLQALIAWRSAEGLDFDLLCYSGYPLATLRQKHPQILALLDAIIAEPFIEKLPQTHIWRGSSNQSMTLLTARARNQFQAYLDAPFDGQEKRIQTMIDGKRIWFVGIPQRSDMPALEKLCAERGLSFEQVSWRQ